MKNETGNNIPDYLQSTYWWAYFHPRAVAFFERQWLVNLILFGNYRKLRDALISELKITDGSRTLQIACAYGDFTSSLLSKIGEKGSVDVIDVAEIQLKNLETKLNGKYSNVHLHHQDSNQLLFENNTFDNVVLFFLLHEQPESVRKLTVQEALRVCKPKGRVVYIDYHGPVKNRILKIFMNFILKTLEPFARDLWEQSIYSLHDNKQAVLVSKQTYFFDLYQKVVVEKI